MKNLINWFEIPAKDINRASKFYRQILGVEIEITEMMGTQMGFLPSDGKNVSGAVVQGDGYEPASNGALIYLNGGDDLENVLSKVEKAGGSVVLQKTQISPEMGYFALFIDCEGNRLALHSKN